MAVRVSQLIDVFCVFLQIFLEGCHFFLKIFLYRDDIVINKRNGGYGGFECHENRR